MATAWVRSLSCRSSYSVTDVAVSGQEASVPGVLRRGREGRRGGCAAGAEAEEEAGKQGAGAAAPAPAPAQEEAEADSAVHAGARARGGVPDDGGAPRGPLVAAGGRAHLLVRVGRRRGAGRGGAVPRAQRGAVRGGAGGRARARRRGNEMMRFQCRGGASADVFGATCSLGASASAVRTFACSGAAHASAGVAAGRGTASGRRAMLVCRVIAGRVRAVDEDHSSAVDYDSVDMGSGELVVLDSRAVLPCFLIIYKV